MSQFRTFAARLVCLIVAIQVLNLSIDAQEFDQLQQHCYSIGYFNQFNSITEYVVEAVMGQRDAFPEDGAHHQKALQVHKHLPFKPFPAPHPVMASAQTGLQQDYLRPWAQDYRFLFCKEINPPPPRCLA